MLLDENGNDKSVENGISDGGNGGIGSSSYAGNVNFWNDNFNNKPIVIKSSGANDGRWWW